MSDNHENRQLNRTMNFYLLGSILIAVCHLTRADYAYGTVRLFTCTGMNPPGRCPYNTQAECDDYCQKIEIYAKNLRGHNARCPYTIYPVFCPHEDPKKCMTYCSNFAHYQKR